MSRVSLWARETEIPPGHLKVARRVLVAVIVVTSVLPLLFVAPDDAPLRINIFKYLAKVGALGGGMLMFWQFLLGFRGVVSTLLPDLAWVVDLHKRLGQFGVPLVLLHPIFIGIYYLQWRDQNIFTLDLRQRFDQFVLLGMVLLAIVAFIVITSAFLRGRLGFYRWLYTHLASYLVPPMLIIHGFALGPTIGGTPFRYVWWTLTGLMIVFYVYRIAHKLGLTSVWHRVERSRVVADGVTEVTMAPDDRRLVPAVGQFVYVRRSLFDNSHPYSVSGWDESTHELAISAKEVGPQTSALQQISDGDRLLIDGPFGVFPRRTMARDIPVVMVAGGIGITAFRMAWQELEGDPERESHLIYANETFGDIAYRDELDALSHVQVTHVLNDEPDFDGEQGLVTLDLLRRHLPRELTDYQFLICGPPVMIHSLEESLLEAGVPDGQISHEVFSV